MTKQFTAMAIMILQSQGRLSVEDLICSYITDCPTAWQDITVHHLLTHTSGLSREISEERYQTMGIADKDAAYFLGLDPPVPLETKPGEQYTYNNFGYILLAYIIEHVSGQTYPAFLEQAIFTPLNMWDTGYENASSEVAVCYLDRVDTTTREYLEPPISEGTGHLYSKTGDLLRWDQALYTDKLLPQADLQRIFIRFVCETPEVPGFGYGYGWFVTQILGQPFVGGAGGGPAFLTFYARYPQDRLTLVVLTNQGGINYFSILMTVIVNLFAYDLVFVLAAVAFNLLLAWVFVAQRNGWGKTARVISIVWFLLSVPFTLVYVHYLGNGVGAKFMVPFTVLLLYILVEFLLDAVFKIDFKRKWATRVAYILLEDIAFFSLIWIAFYIGLTSGYLVSITFCILFASSILLHTNEITVRRQHADMQKG